MSRRRDGALIDRFSVLNTAAITASSSTAVTHALQFAVVGDHAPSGFGKRPAKKYSKTPTWAA